MITKRIALILAVFATQPLSVAFADADTGIAEVEMAASLTEETPALDVAAAEDAAPATEITAESEVFASVISDDVLNENRGTFAPIIITSTSLSAISTGNTVIGGETGDNYVDGGAFDGASGITTLIVNSGNNVVIQQSNALTVNFQ